MVNQPIPDWISSHLNQTDLLRIKEAVGEAESHTSAEIVPLVVRRSLTFAYAPIMLFLGVWLLFSIVSCTPFDASSEAVKFIYKELFFIVSSLVLVRIFLFLPISKKFGPVANELSAAAQNRALTEFYRARLDNTAQKTGVLLFISYEERRVVILADEKINEIFEQNVWDETCQDLIKSIKAGQMSEGIVLAVDKLGKLLKKDFPIQDDDKNELTDHLIIRD